MPAPLEIQVITINSATWTQVIVPFDCTSISLRNADEVNSVSMRTDPANALTEDQLGPGREQAFAVPFHRYRFPAGSQPLFLRAVAGTGPVVAKFLA